MPWTRDAAALLDRCRHDGLVVPDYDGYCFANVPGTVGEVLGVDVGPTLPGDVLAGVDTDVSHVVVVLLDGLGWHRFHRDAGDHRFLGRLVESGRVTPLTATLPSSTASAITTVHTAATPAEHGVLGWDVRLPAHDTIVEVFLDSVRADVAVGSDGTEWSDGTEVSDGTEWSDGTDEPDHADGPVDAEGSNEPPMGPGAIVRADPVYPRFEGAGIGTHVVQPTETLGTAYADSTFRGATAVAYEGIEDGAATLADRVATSDGQSYTYCYVPDVDTASHEYGTDSGAYHDALARVTTHLASALYDELDGGTAAETLLVVTADHGMVDFEPGCSGYIDLYAVDGFPDALARRPSGEPVPPWGDHRLLHLAVRDGERRRICEVLESLGARVLTRDEVGERGLYGPGDALAERCGDVVCTHPDEKLVHPASATIVPKVGMHGGPTPREMLVPFAAARLSRLQH